MNPIELAARLRLPQAGLFNTFDEVIEAVNKLLDQSQVVEVKKLAVGDLLHGFCGGQFGRDSYCDKWVEAIGSDWVVAREDRENHDPERWPTIMFYQGDPQKLVEYLGREDDNDY